MLWFIVFSDLSHLIFGPPQNAVKNAKPSYKLRRIILISWHLNIVLSCVINMLAYVIIEKSITNKGMITKNI